MTRQRSKCFGRSNPCTPKKRLGCESSNHPPLDSLHKIVDAYIKQFRKIAREELRFYRNQSSFREAIRHAALAGGKRCCHQRRIPHEVLLESRNRLLNAIPRLRKCQTYEELHDLTSDIISDVHGIGPLTVYDTAHRIGAYLGLQPKRVYLHAGTREGAKALGLKRAGPNITMSQLPVPFRRLQPYEFEDCLCIYKCEIEQAMNSKS